MLAGMESGDFAEAPPVPQKAPTTTRAAASSQPSANAPDMEEIGEIAEFAGSEFSSDPEMIKDFMENATELMQSLDEQILVLESNPSSKETIEEIFRAAHTLKGAAGMFGYKAIERVMHKMENFFDRVRKGQIVANPDGIDVVLRGIDLLKALMQGVSAGAPTGIATAPIVRELALLGDGKYVKGAVAAKPKSESPGPAAAKTAPSEPPGSQGGGAQKAKKQEESTIRVDLKRLDALVNLVGELVTDRTRFMNIEEELRIINPQLKATQNMSQTVQLFGRHMNEIQDTIMKVRMVPIGNAFNKFGRIVRDLARQLDKEIELVIEGETTELDKTLVEQIGDPLVHLIRNSCDHGIESPADRKKNGKKTMGVIVLSARQEGNQIMITIEDDGKGINTDIIRKKGIEKGLITEEAILTDRDIFGLIFEPGFSTVEHVTNISGRGVGMDVVKRQIMKLKGMIDISSQVGSGTTITIQLPLTLAIVQSLLVKSKDEIFAIPLTSVVESIRISPKEIQKVGDAEVIKRRDQVLPLYYLDEILELSNRDWVFWYKKQENNPSGTTDKNRTNRRRREERLFVVVVGSVDHRFGIVVDTLLNQQEMVIKTMGNLVSSIPCVAGGAILGNGEVVLVLDTVEMDALIRSKGRLNQAA
jgi:two-component system chemotaxis sensor kinase CheA